jgi:hypothetical protein
MTSAGRSRKSTRNLITMKRSLLKSVAIPAAPLFIGGLVYLLWRSTSLLMFRWFDLVGLHSVVDAIRIVAAPMRDYMPSWTLYSLPDAAWVSCGVLLFAAIWSGSRHPARHFWVLLAPSLALSGEFAQLLSLLPGTFDIADVTACMLLCALSIVVANLPFNYGIRPNQA